MKNTGKFFLELFSGFSVSSIVISIFVGSVNTFFTLLFISVVCTLGISLVIWVPAWWFIGWIIVKIYHRITAGGKVNQDGQKGAIVDYIKKAKAKGYSDSQIATRLSAHGWTDEEIQAAHQVVQLE